MHWISYLLPSRTVPIEQEEVFDYIFEHLGVSSSRVAHDIVMTEPVSNPNYCRGRMFLVYRAP